MAIDHACRVHKDACPPSHGSGSKSKSEDVAKSKDMILSLPCRLSVLGFSDRICGKAGHQEHAAHSYSGVHDLGMKGRILVRNARVKGDPRVVSIFQVDLSCSSPGPSHDIAGEWDTSAWQMLSEGRPASPAVPQLVIWRWAADFGTFSHSTDIDTVPQNAYASGFLWGTTAGLELGVC